MDPAPKPTSRPQGEKRAAPTAAPSGRDRALLWLWCLACFVASVSLFVYLPMSTLVEMEELSEHPGPLTLVFGVAAAAALAIFLITRGRPAFQGGLRRSLWVGTIAALLGFGTYAGYLASTDLKPAVDAPQVGETAPDFRIVDPDGREFWLMDFRGGPVLLVFYRGVW